MANSKAVIQKGIKAKGNLANSISEMHEFFNSKVSKKFQKEMAEDVFGDLESLYVEMQYLLGEC